MACKIFQIRLMGMYLESQFSHVHLSQFLVLQNANSLNCQGLLSGFVTTLLAFLLLRVSHASP